ncbi:MAG: hypothetical protein PHG67_02120 [Bacteroidales bacterium]|nr:hypothetical protein [Bacteroidales bacterium]
MTSQESVMKSRTRLLQLLVGTFAITYYIFIALLDLSALIFNKYIIEWAGLGANPVTFDIFPVWVVMLVLFLLNTLIIVGFFRYFRKGTKWMVLFFGIILIGVQIMIGGFEGWQKLLLEAIIMALIIIIPTQKNTSRILQNTENLG